MPDWIWDFVDQLFRGLIWFFDRWILKLADFVYGIIQDFFGLNIGQFSFIWKIYWIVAGGVATFAIVRLVCMMFKALYDDDSSWKKMDSFNLFRRMIAIGLLLTLIPILMPGISSITADVSTHVADVITDEKNVTPSDIIVESGLVDFKDMKSSITISKDNGQHYVDVIVGDAINEKTTVKNSEGKDVKEYKYFQDTSNLVLILIGACCAGYCFFFIAIQIVQRLIGLLIKMAAAPWAISSLVDPADNTFSTWSKLCLADFLISFFQVLAVWISIIFVQKFPSGYGAIAKGIAFVAALFAIVNAPSGIAQLFGGDIGAGTAMQSMHSMQMMMGSVNTATHLASTAMTAGTSLVSGAMTAGAAMTYAAGRVMGGKTLNPNQINFGNDGGSTPPFGGSGSAGGNTFGPDGGSGGSAGGNPFDGGGTHPGIGGSSMVNEGATMTASLDGGYGYGGQSGSYYSGSDYAGGSYDGGTYDGVEMASTGSGTFLNTTSSASMNSASIGDNNIVSYSGGMTKGGSVANRVSTKLNSTPVGAMASTFATHMYQRAGRRLFETNSQRNIRSNRTIGEKLNGTKSSIRDYGTGFMTGMDNKMQHEVERFNEKLDSGDPLRKRF